MTNGNFSAYHNYVRIKLFSTIILIAPFFIFSPGVQAETSSITGTNGSTVTTTKQTAVQEQRDLMMKNKLETKAMMQDKKEQFKAKLQIIRDERKKALVERIDEKISTMNKTSTARFSAVLEKLMMVLDRITQKAQVTKAKGVDTSMADQAIVAAKTAIDAAKAAVAGQSAKTYSIDVVSETTLKTTVGSTVSMFRKDLSTVHKLVIDAKQAVQKAEKELAKSRGEKMMEKLGENSANVTTPSATEK